MREFTSAAASVAVRARDDWDYDKRFLPTDESRSLEIFARANEFQANARIERHPFFGIAKTDPGALELWAAQEAVVTGPFSQLLLLAASQLENVHHRACFLEVIVGEHHGMHEGVASSSHPWLLHRLCRSMGIQGRDVRPLPPTVKFLEDLASATSSVLTALGALGVGNERMLIPEYGAVRECFASCYPQADFRAFLVANINEDTEHTRLIEQVAAGVIGSGGDANEYLIGAELGVTARVDYYNALLHHFEEVMV